MRYIGLFWSSCFHAGPHSSLFTGPTDVGPSHSFRQNIWLSASGRNVFNKRRHLSSGLLRVRWSDEGLTGLAPSSDITHSQLAQRFPSVLFAEASMAEVGTIRSKESRTCETIQRVTNQPERVWVCTGGGKPKQTHCNQYTCNMLNPALSNHHWIIFQLLRNCINMYYTLGLKQILINYRLHAHMVVRPGNKAAFKCKFPLNVKNKSSCQMCLSLLRHICI